MCTETPLSSVRSRAAPVPAGGPNREPVPASEPNRAHRVGEGPGAPLCPVPHHPPTPEAGRGEPARRAPSPRGHARARAQPGRRGQGRGSAVLAPGGGWAPLLLLPEGRGSPPSPRPTAGGADTIAFPGTWALPPFSPFSQGRDIPLKPGRRGLTRLALSVWPFSAAVSLLPALGRAAPGARLAAPGPSAPRPPMEGRSNGPTGLGPASPLAGDRAPSPGWFQTRSGRRAVRLSPAAPRALHPPSFVPFPLSRPPTSSAPPPPAPRAASS